MMFFREVDTERLFLKNISPEDRNFIWDQFSSNEVNRYLFDAEPLVDMRGVDEIIELYTQPEPRAQHRWILVKKDDSIKIGTCGFHCWNEVNATCDVGYDLQPQHWGKGYMAEAMRAIISFAQEDMKVKRIDACIYPENQRSALLAERLGFSFCGQVRDETFRGERYAHKIFTLNSPGV